MPNILIAEVTKTSNAILLDADSLYASFLDASKWLRNSKGIIETYNEIRSVIRKTVHR
jgi:hypothetical protein